MEDIYRTDDAHELATAFDPGNPSQQGLQPSGLFRSGALFTQVIVAPVGRTVWISGLIGCTAENVLVVGGKAPQIAQAFTNLRAAMAAAGCKPEHCVRITEYMVDYVQADIDLVKPEIRTLFGRGMLPTNVLVPVPRLGRDGALFEIDAVCVFPT